MSPLVWPRPSCISLTSSLPSQTVISPLKVSVGQVRPGIVSTARKRRGKRSISLFMSSAPRSTIRSRVSSLAMISLAPSLRVGAGAEHAHRVVVAHHDVLDRLVGDLADAPDHVLGHHRRGLRVDHHHRVVADDDAGVRVALGGVGVGVVGEPGEGDLLVGEIGLRGEGFAHGGCHGWMSEAAIAAGAISAGSAAAWRGTTATASWKRSGSSATLRCEASSKIAQLGAGDALGDRARHLRRRADVAGAGDDERRQADGREAIEPVDAGDGVAARPRSRRDRSAAGARATLRRRPGARRGTRRCR